MYNALIFSHQALLACIGRSTWASQGKLGYACTLQEHTQIYVSVLCKEQWQLAAGMG